MAGKPDEKDVMKSFLTRVSHHADRLSTLLFLLIFLIAVILVLQSGNQLRYPDEHDYNRLAQCLRGGEGFVNESGAPTAYRAPGWPVVLAALYTIHHHPITAKFFNALALAATALLLSKLAGRFSPLARIAAPLFLLLYPVGFYAATTLYPQTVGALLLVAITALLTPPRHRLRHTLAAGILLGILILTIPAFLATPPLFLLGLYVLERKSPTVFFKRAALLLGCTVLLVTPWTLRNAQVFNRLVPVSTNSGVNLLLGNNENAHPSSGVNVDISDYQAKTKHLNEAAADAHYRAEAVTWIQKNPGRFAQLYALKVINYFNFTNELYVESEANRLRDLVMALSYYPLLLLVLIRLALFKKIPLAATEKLLAILYFGNALAAAVFFTRIRFRIPFDALLIILAAAALATALEIYRTKIQGVPGQAPSPTVHVEHKESIP